MPAPHSPESRQRAVRLAREGTTPVAKIAKDLGISNSCLRNWMAQADADENSGGQRLTSAEKKGLAELRRRNRVLSRRMRSCGAPRSGWSMSSLADGMDTAMACRALGVSRSGYYEWKVRPESARESGDIETVHFSGYMNDCLGMLPLDRGDSDHGD
jgi:transposase-like protein